MHLCFSSTEQDQEFHTTLNRCLALLLTSQACKVYIGQGRQKQLISAEKSKNEHSLILDLIYIQRNITFSLLHDQ